MARKPTKLLRRPTTVNNAFLQATLIHQRALRWPQSERSHASATALRMAADPVDARGLTYLEDIKKIGRAHV